MPYLAIRAWRRGGTRSRQPTGAGRQMDQATKSGFSAAERNVLFITCPCHFLTHFFILVFPAITMPMVATFGMPLEDVVKLSFVMYLAYGLGALPAGYLVDRWQAKGMLVIGLVLMGGGLVLAGAFPRPASMAALLGIVGAGASIYHPAGLALISRTVQRRGYALGINGVFGNLGIAAAPLLSGVLTWLFTWQATLLILGAAGLATGALLAAVRIDESATRQSRTFEARGVDRARYFLILCFCLVLAGLAYRGNMLLLPAYLQLKTTFFHRLIDTLSFVKPQGTATLAATVLTSLVLLTGIVGQFLGGKLADRTDLRRAYLLVHGSSLPCIFLMAFTTNYWLALCAALYAFFSLGMQPVENSLIAALTPRRWRSTSYAVKFILNFGIGSTVVYMIGPIKHAYSLSMVYVFLSGATMLLVAGIVVLLIASRSVPSIRN
jgi:MFS family permease